MICSAPISKMNSSTKPDNVIFLKKIEFHSFFLSSVLFATVTSSAELRAGPSFGDSF